MNNTIKMTIRSANPFELARILREDVRNINADHALPNVAMIANSGLTTVGYIENGVGSIEVEFLTTGAASDDGRICAEVLKSAETHESLLVGAIGGTVVKATVMPAGIGEMTGDTIVECWDGISGATYKEVWSFVNEAHRTSRAIHAEDEKWMAGRGSNLRGGGDTMDCIWSKLSEDAKRDIIAAYDIEFTQ